MKTAIIVLVMLSSTFSLARWADLVPSDQDVKSQVAEAVVRMYVLPSPSELEFSANMALALANDVCRRQKLASLQYFSEVAKILEQAIQVQPHEVRRAIDRHILALVQFRLATLSPAPRNEEFVKLAIEQLEIAHLEVEAYPDISTLFTHTLEVARGKTPGFTHLFRRFIVQLIFPKRAK